MHEYSMLSTLQTKYQGLISQASTETMPAVRNLCCIGAGYEGGPSMAVIADRCLLIEFTVVVLNSVRIAASNGDYLGGDRSAVGYDREHDSAKAVQQQSGVKCQRTGLAFVQCWITQHQGAIESLNIDAGIAQPAMTASLPAGGQAMAQVQHVVKRSKQTVWLGSRAIPINASSTR